MAVPKRKKSLQAKRKRRSHHALKTPNLVTVDGEKISHRLVKFFKRRQELDKKLIRQVKRQNKNQD